MEREDTSTRTCVKCIHLRTKGGIFAFCSLGLWQKADGEPKFIRLENIEKRKQILQATRCPDYTGDD